MTFLSTWNILGIVAIISLLIFFFKGKNAIWGGLTIGAVVGLVIGLINAGSIDWVTVKKGAISGTLAGVFFEIVGQLTKKYR